MNVTYWGVRGSMPVPGPRTVRFGGNTACVTVRQGDSLLVIDAGTGIVDLGSRLDPRIQQVFLLLTHRHMDHVQGLPFFEPLYTGDAHVALLDVRLARGFWSPIALFDGIAVPMRPPALNGRVRRVAGDAMAALRREGWEVAGMALRHPGGSRGIRVFEGGRSFVHLTDTELSGAAARDRYFERCVEFCRGAQVLSHDAQYLEREMWDRRGRGHSSVERVCDLAEAAGVGRLVLFHHDPERTDEELEEVEGWAARRLGPVGIECVAAREGLALEI